MNRLVMSPAIPANMLKIEALSSLSPSFEWFCLAAGLEALDQMMEADARTAPGPSHGCGKGRRAHRWGKMAGSASPAARWRLSASGFAGSMASEPPRAAHQFTPPCPQPSIQAGNQSCCAIFVIHIRWKFF